MRRRVVVPRGRNRRRRQGEGTARHRRGRHEGILGHRLRERSSHGDRAGRRQPEGRALLQRPNLARLEISGAGQDALIVLDGASSWHYLKARNGYFKSKQLGTSKLEQYGVGPAATLFFEKEAGSLTPCLSDAVVTREKLGDEECSVVTWTVGAEQSSLWIVGDRLRRFRTTRSIAQPAVGFDEAALRSALEAVLEQGSE